jgi:glycosyltransferase involved in cell wall biosynthesis
VHCLQPTANRHCLLVVSRGALPCARTGVGSRGALPCARTGVGSRGALPCARTGVGSRGALPCARTGVGSRGALQCARSIEEIMENMSVSKRLSIVYVSTSLEGGGAEMMLYHLVSHLNREQFDVAVVSLIDPSAAIRDRFQTLGISVHSIGMKRGVPTISMFWRLIQTLRQLQPDLIQGWMYHGNLAAQVANFFLGVKIPVLWSIHYSISCLATDKLMTRLLIQGGSKLSGFPARILFVSKISKEQHGALGYCPETSLVVPNGFNTDTFVPNPTARLTVRTELGLAEDTIAIGSFARYNPMKDHPNFLRAAALLHQHYPDVHFLLAGENVDSANQTLQQLIAELGLTNCVHLLGERRDVSTLMAGLDIVSSASAYGEAFPMIIGEAMSCGVPCAVTDVGDSAWIVGNTGKVVAPQDAPALAQAWQELVELGTEGRATLGLSARARIVENFSLEKIVHQYESLYKYILVQVPS